MRTGIEYMTWLAQHDQTVTAQAPLGMFQIGGGIAGDFPEPGEGGITSL